MNVNPFSYLIEKLKGKVDKSGDTMTGTLNIEATNDTPLTLKRTNSSSSVMMNFYNQNGIVGGYVAGNDGKPYYRKSDGTYPQIALTSDIDKGSVYVTGNGSKSYATCLNELFALADTTKISETSRLKMEWSNYGADIYHFMEVNSAIYRFSSILVSATQININGIDLDSNNSKLFASTNGTISDYSANAVPNGRKLTLYY